MKYPDRYVYTRKKPQGSKKKKKREQRRPLKKVEKNKSQVHYAKQIANVVCHPTFRSAVKMLPVPGAGTVGAAIDFGCDLKKKLTA